MANRRQGTHKTLEKSEISRSTRKLKRQKGQVQQVGSIKSPLLRGGARVFGPHPRDYGFKLNKKVKQLGTENLRFHTKQRWCSIAILLKTSNGAAPKTKEFISDYGEFEAL